jgi:hypothetical protein
MTLRQAALRLQGRPTTGDPLNQSWHDIGDTAGPVL